MQLEGRVGRDPLCRADPDPCAAFESEAHLVLAAEILGNLDPRPKAVDAVLAPPESDVLRPDRQHRLGARKEAIAGAHAQPELLAGSLDEACCGRGADPN